MKKRFSEEQIIQVIKEVKAGLPVTEVCRKYSVMLPAYYSCKAKFGGMSVSEEVQRLKSLEEEKRKLKRLVADYALDNVALKDLSSKKW